MKNDKQRDSNIDVEHAKVVPHAEFTAPEDVLTSDLSHQDKAKVLKQWEVDEQALSRAGDEGMTDGEGHRIGAVQAARRKVLGSKPGTKDRRTAGKPAG